MCTRVCVGRRHWDGTKGPTFARTTLGAQVGSLVPRALVFCYLINFG